MNNKDNVWSNVVELNNDVKTLSNQEFIQLPVLGEVAENNVQSGSDFGNSNRRDFLKYLGFSLGAATLAASCKSPIRKAIPYVVKPDAIVPGVATYYASSFVKGNDYCSVLVKTRDGRPIKIEGNKLSSVSKGGTSARAQASVLDLYDTNRLKGPSSLKNGVAKNMTWAEIDQLLVSKLNNASRISLVSNTISSPSTLAVLEEFKVAFPNTKVVQYDSFSYSALLDANAEDFGKRVMPSYNFDKAERVVSFNADFLGTWGSPVTFASAYASKRKIDDVKQASMSRHYQVESTMTLTGSNADHRVLVKPSEQGVAILSLYNKVASILGGAALSGNVKLSNPKADKQLSVIAEDLAANEGKSLVVSASTNVAEQKIVNALNALLKSYGNTITFNDYNKMIAGSDKDMLQLVADAKSGAVDAVFFMNCNPAYDFAFANELKAALSKVKYKFSTNALLDETTALCDYSIPDNHYLESWGDVEPNNGTFSLIQPTIAPLFDTRQMQDTFLKLLAKGQYVDYLKNYWISTVYSKQSRFASPVKFWEMSLHDGVCATAAPVDSTTYIGTPSASGVTKPSTGALEVFLYPSAQVGMGEYANNPWLQELPDPVTRTVWGNHLLVNLEWDGVNKYNGFQDLKEGDIVEVSLDGGKTTLTLPVVLQFGQLAGTAAIALGYGREKAGLSGSNTGINVLPFVKKSNDTFSYFAENITVKKVKDYRFAEPEFASVQMHHTLGVTGIDTTTGKEVNVDEKIFGFQGSLTKRSIIRTANLPELSKEVKALQEERHHHQLLNANTLYKKPEVTAKEAVDAHGKHDAHAAHGHDAHASQDGVKDQEKLLEGEYATVHKDLYAMGHHWGMNVDLSSCTGCGACQVACMAENNVPVVGKAEVARHHEMTWLRIDRYYYGDVENPNTVYQPMMCQHCDNAPCENVCPVAATNHSSEGLNQMTYNRCIGTRYCANNCPYKVRRLNWFDYTTADLFPWNENKINGEETPYYADDLVRMVLNPDVTVRSRGVIEKCSFCVQRLQEAKLKAKVESRRMMDGEASVACQTACPSGSITFGDMNDKSSKVFKLNNDARNYKVLEETNVQSSVGYLMKVMNKNVKFEA